ncbi:MAG: protein kinase [Planctomycetaceae bacterium]|nr:protein kinase [Planctomycetaceae bacterium]
MFQFLKKHYESGQRRKPVAHLTFGGSRMSQTVSRASLILKKQLWIWPIIAVLLLAAVGYGVRTAISNTISDNLRSQLQTLLDVETAMLRTWFRVQESNAESAANSIRIRELTHQLLKTPSNASADRTEAGGSVEDPHAQILHELSPVMSSHNYIGYFIADRDQKICSASSRELVDRVAIPELESLISRTLNGTTTICAPFPSVDAIRDDRDKVRTGVPNMFVCAPIRDERFQVVGALALQFRPELEFTDILQLGRLGVSGETYAFDRSGVMVSNSRFDEDLILSGFLADRSDSRSILNIEIRDPGVNLTRGLRPAVRRSEQPLTSMAAQAISGDSGISVEPYRDYRGVEVVGAWNWLEPYEMGIATEIDYEEAFRPMTILQWMFTGLYVLLGMSSFAIFVFTVIVAKLQKDAQKAAIEAKQLGQYELDEKLGAGGMGVVYKAHHAMLRRPTAVKMLDIDKVDAASTARFEREVQITCQLNHPNTIAIYDYGRTPEGLFYYAMEYLDGLDLQQLVEKFGPQPEGRVIRILSQVCGSLYEAHTRGLVHRDIKPSNIMLNRRGSEPDVVKVLDFGLVKALDEEKVAGMTGTSSLTGTPLYMSPEAIQSPLAVDNRSDLYAVGAVGYFLLTGQPVFSASNIVELCRQHVDQSPMPPSQRLGRGISSELEHAILACLEKNRAKRPQTARDLANMLARCPEAQSWTTDAADSWWSRFERGLAPGHINSSMAVVAGAKPHSTETVSSEENAVSRHSAFEQTFVSGEID